MEQNYLDSNLSAEQLKQKVAENQAKIKEMAELHQLRQQELQQRRSIAEWNTKLQEVEKQLTSDVSNPLRMNVKQMQLSEVNTDNLGDLRNAISKHATTQLEANANKMNDYTKNVLESYVSDMARFVWSVKQDKKLLGEGHPYPNEVDLAERCEYILRIKPFVKVRMPNP